MKLRTSARLARLTRGFTLIELMITVAIAAILLMVVAPSFSEAILGNKLAAFANNFIASAQLARSESIKRNATVQMCRSADGATCAASGGWQQGWIVFHDADNNTERDAGETLIQVQQALSPDYRMTGDSYSLAFQASGVGVSPANLSLCRLQPSPGAQERTIVVSATGRASVTTTRTATCASS